MNLNIVKVLVIPKPIYIFNLMEKNYNETENFFFNSSGRISLLKFLTQFWKSKNNEGRLASPNA